MQVRFLAIAVLAGGSTMGLSTVLAEGGSRAWSPQSYESERELRLRSMDRDNDGVITRAEWLGTEEGFRQLDVNRDGVLSGDEVRQIAEPGRGSQVDELRVVFDRADTNGDRRLSRSEWYGNSSTFTRLDRNGDGVISRGEFISASARSKAAPAFEERDRNRNGVITRNEWDDDLELFRRMDTDGDTVLTREEYRTGVEDRGRDRSETTSAAFRAGRERGLADGRQAGREDRTINRGVWDLEGQRELETADAGYSPSVGSREEYQRGYREGFRVGYREGFGPR